MSSLIEGSDNEREGSNLTAYEDEDVETPECYEDLDYQSNMLVNFSVHSEPLLDYSKDNKDVAGFGSGGIIPFFEKT